MTLILRKVALASLTFILVEAFVHAQSAVYKLHSDSSCSSVPTMIGFQQSPSPSCSAITTCSSVNIDNEKLFWNRACASDEYDSLAASAYGNKPFVLMEIYESGGECKKLLSGVALQADGSCLVTDNGESSMKVSLSVDGSATFATYRGVSCSNTAVKTTKITEASITSHSCENGALKFYSSMTTTTDGSDKSISTTTSQSTPNSFGSSILIVGHHSKADTIEYEHFVFFHTSWYAGECYCKAVISSHTFDKASHGADDI